MLIRNTDKVGFRLGINGVWGNMGVAAAPVLTGFLIVYSDWRTGFSCTSNNMLSFWCNSILWFY